MEENKEQQQFFMRWAIQLGEQGRCTAPPNPWVGCVIVKNGERFHEAPGKKHAEIMAIEKAGSRAKGATAYVSLEPCAHQGRTPPCVTSLIQAGIGKVIVPLLDPDPQVSGKGIRLLKQAGIEVVVGVAKEEAQSSLAPYLFQRTRQLPYCVLKAALSLDGRIAACNGSSQWITGEKARENVHLLRGQSQAIIIGAKTALKDKPQLTVRVGNHPRQPLRVLLDLKGQVSPEGPLADATLAPTLVFTGSTFARKKWEKKGIEVMEQSSWELKEVLAELGRREVIQVLVEGGGNLYTNFLKGKLVNRMVLYMGNCLLGDQGIPFLPNFPVSDISHAARWHLEGVQRFEQDVRLDFLPRD
jgi:diaminohydroxyphosphoribosylaminopyrimidine deaminase/5-amino-6-(5-phosphoribosylamino)uracil reductase